MKEVTKRMLKALVIWLIQGILGFATILFFAVMLAEWVAGCGETYIDSKGIRHNHECVFMPSQNKEKQNKTSRNT